MMNSRKAFARLAFSTIAVPAALWAGCSSEKPTELVSGITTQMQVPKDLKAVGFIVQRNGGPPQCRAYEVQIIDGEGFVTLPRTLATEPAVDAKIPVTITILGFKTVPPDDFETTCLASAKSLNAGKQADGKDNANGIAILRRSRTPYVDGRILYLPMPLKQACIDRECKDENTTCKAGKCVPMDIDPTKLVDYSDRLIFGSTNTCFTAVESKNQQERGAVPCFPRQGTLPAAVVNKDICLYDVPIPDPLPPQLKPKGVNVRITYANFNTEVLDLDPATTPPDDMEGFFIPDPKMPYRFQLAPNLCNLVKGIEDGVKIPPKIMAVQTSFFCPSKTALQPICADDSRIIQETGTGVEGQPNQTCFAEGALEPAPSSLYVLLDRSKSMKDFFGERSGEGLKDVIGLSLQDPALIYTKIAFKFVPAAETECSTTQTTPNAYGTLTGPDAIPFGDPETVRAAIGVKVGDPANLLPTDGPLVIDAAMRPGGAYQALLNERQGPGEAQPKRFNRQALMLIGNREFIAHCGQGTPSAGLPSAGELARAAFASPAKLYTYVVLLDRRDDNGTPDFVEDDKRGPAIQQSAIAAADVVAFEGGTRAFIAVKDSVAESGLEAAKAITSVVNDLSSCLYQPSKELTDAAAAAGGAKLPTFKLSYLNFSFDGQSVTSEKVDIPFNPACNEGATDNAGWNLDSDSRVRICGAPCQSLRDSLLQSTLFAARSTPRQPAPGIPIRVNRPCE